MPLLSRVRVQGLECRSDLTFEGGLPFFCGQGGDVGTIFVCSDRRRAVDKMIGEYGSEFRIITQVRRV